MSENGNYQGQNHEVNAVQAGFCAALSDPHRIRIIYELSNSPSNVKSLAEILDLSQSATSRHLKILREKNLVKPQRQGHMVEYGLAAPELIDVLSILLDILNEQTAHRASLIELERQNEDK